MAGEGTSTYSLGVNGSKRDRYLVSNNRMELSGYLVSSIQGLFRLVDLCHFWWLRGCDM